MSLTTIIEACSPALYKFALSGKNSEFEYSSHFRNQYQGTNRKILHNKGCCSELREQKFKVCPAKAHRLLLSKCPPPSSACAAICGGKANNKVKMRENALVEMLENMRDPIAEYQEKLGLPRSEQYGFVNLITSLSQHGYQAILTIFTMLYNLLPLLEGFSYLARFILDKLLDICQTQERTEKMIKISMFVGELIIIILMLMIIFGFILLPVWLLFAHILSKIWYMLLSTG